MMTKHRVAYISLGSNLGDARQHVEQALVVLNQLDEQGCCQVSQLYRTKPIGPGEQADYVNAVCSLSTALSAPQLLAELHQIEQAHGRQRLVRWGARTLDLDLLLIGDEKIDSELLTVPHPRMHERAFVLLPLADLVNELDIPGQGQLSALLKQCDCSDVIAMT